MRLKGFIRVLLPSGIRKNKKGEIIEMKKKYLASLTIASVLLPAFIAGQTGIAAEVEGTIGVPTVSEVQPEAPQTTPAVEVPVPVVPIPEAAPEAVQIPEVSNTPTKQEDATGTGISEQPIAEAQGGGEEAKPLDVNPFPPTLPSDTAPAINLIPVQSIRKGTAFDPMAGVVATDTLDGDITSLVTYTGSVDVNVVGQYPITYSVTNSRGQTARQLAIIDVIEDNIGMYSIELADFSLPKGSDYIQAIRERIMIKDEDGSVIPTADANIQVSGYHSTDQVGSIAVEVTVLSHYNTITKKIVTITITDDTSSEGSVRIDASDVTLKIGDTFDPYAYVKGFEIDALGAETALAPATDASGIGVYVLSNDVDPTIVGTYSVTYQARSTSGTVVTKTIVVTVTKNTSDRKPTILVTDKVMYVGDVLTKEMILAWATTEDPTDVVTGFTVMNGGIPVEALSDTLIEPGVHEIQFTAETAEGISGEKQMTLTVKEPVVPIAPDEPGLPKEPLKNIEAGKTDTQTIQLVQKITTEQKEIVKTSAKELPETGETSNNVFLQLLGLVMNLGIATYLLKRKNSNEELE